MTDIVGPITQETFAAPGICWQDEPSQDASGDAAGDQAEADDADSDAAAMPTPMLSKKRKRRATPSSEKAKRKKWSPAQRDPGEPDLTKSR